MHDLYHDPRPVDRVDTAHIVGGHKVPVHEHVLDGLVKVVRRPGNWGQTPPEWGGGGGVIRTMNSGSGGG